MCKWILFVTVLFLYLPTSSRADEVILKNGERLVGKIVQLQEGKLIIDSEGMGKVTTSLDKVSTFSSTEPLEIHFQDGTVLVRKVEPGFDGQVVVTAGDEAAPLSFAIENLEKINPSKAVWKGSISAGATITRGNSYTQAAFASLRAERRSEKDRISFQAGYASGRQEDPDTGDLNTTQRESFVSLQYDYFFTKKVYGYANARGERDAIADLDLRFIAGAGAGWQIVEEPDFTFSTEAGLSWISENFYPPTPDEEYLSGRIAYSLEKSFNSAVTFFNDVNWYPGFESEGGHYVNAVAGLRSSLTDSMFAEAKAVWDWDSTPAEGKERTDVTYFFSLGWSF